MRKHFLIEVSNAHHLNKTFNHLGGQGDTVSIKARKGKPGRGKLIFALPQSGKALGRDKKDHKKKMLPSMPLETLETLDAEITAAGAN